MPDSLLEVLPDQATVLDELRDLLPGLRQAVFAAKDRMEQNPVENRAFHRSTTTAIGMVDYMVAEGKLLFTGNPRVFFRDDEETWLVIDQRYDLRLRSCPTVGCPEHGNKPSATDHVASPAAWLPPCAPERWVG